MRQAKRFYMTGAPTRRWWGALLLLPLAAAALLLVSRAGVAAPDAKTLYERMGCAECHGADGRTPRWDTTPIIAGQMPKYSYLVLKAYKTGERQGVGANLHVEVSDLLTDAQMKVLAEYVATLK